MFFPDYVFRFLLCSQLSTVMLLWAVNANDQCPDSFDCGSLGSIRFPFTKAGREGCGALAIHGCDDMQQFHFINITGKKFDVTKIDQWLPSVNFILIIDEDLRKLLESGSCEVFDRKITLPPLSHLGSFNVPIWNEITLFKCKRNLDVRAPEGYLNNISCGYNIFYAPTPGYDDVALHSLTACSTVQLPTIIGRPISANPFEFLTAKIPIQFIPSDECVQCQGHDPDLRPRGRCFLDREGNFHCAKRKDTTSARMLGLLLLAASSSVVALLLLLACCFKRKLSSQTIRCFWNKHVPTDEVMIECFLKLHGSLPTITYSYSEIKKATNSFKVKLGQGGYGSVYKGRLQDGRLVAVKILRELKGTGEEFINEVASICRTSHVNIVTLVGFCFQGSKRALIYEFMPNGSLEKFIQEENFEKIGRQLDCKTLYDIAFGVARGLDYLHKGCNTRILHFDIKPHNISLDEDFSPKISDFGLAKICPRKESIVSITCTRGTIGYIAPEVFSRNFGEVSHKADVYSYGMMALEMVGGRHNKNVQVDRSSDLYFPHWIYKRLELNQDFGLRCIKNEIDRKIVKKMTLVSLWCIQTDPSCHPSMNKVVEMLEGSLESLELPPKPYLRSSPTSLADYSTQTSETL